MLKLTFTGSTLTLNPVLSALGAVLDPGLAATNVGNTVITLPLTIDTSTQPRESPKATIGCTVKATDVISPDNLGAVGAILLLPRSQADSGCRCGSDPESIPHRERHSTSRNGPMQYLSPLHEDETSLRQCVGA